MLTYRLDRLESTLQYGAFIVGLSANSIQWGAWHGVGMVSENQAVLNRMRKSGIETVSPLMGLSVLQKVFQETLMCSQVQIFEILSCFSVQAYSQIWLNKVLL